MLQGWMPGRLAVSIVAAAVLLRIGFVIWAPRELSGDAFHYHLSAVALLDGSGYTDLDGSPAVRWMPGWPVVIAALYSVFGIAPAAAMALNALAGGVTVAVLIRVGMLWFSMACGLWAGALYAVWPGNIYYTATLMTEPLFNALLALCVLAIVEAARSPDRRRSGIWTAAAGLALGSAAFVKAESWVLLPALLAFGWCAYPRHLRLQALLLFGLTACVWLVPWSVRNYLAFERFVPTTATAGANAWLGNHPGASGGQSIREMSEFMARHRRDSVAQTLFAASDAGWREVSRFATERPGEALAIVGNKLALTYSSDGQGARLVRGVGVGPAGFISETQRRALEIAANAYWAAIAVLVVIGLLGSRSWSMATRCICLGVPLSWLVVHLVFLGGPRFHVPETPIYAWIAASAIVRFTASGSIRPEGSHGR